MTPNAIFVGGIDTGVRLVLKIPVTVKKWLIHMTPGLVQYSTACIKKGSTHFFVFRLEIPSHPLDESN